MTNYANGARLERLARKRLEEDGYTVVRAAGSKGPIDLVAFDARGLRLIQVKGAGAARRADRAVLAHLPRPAFATVELWEREDGGWKVEALGAPERLREIAP